MNSRRPVRGLLLAALLLLLGAVAARLVQSRHEAEPSATAAHP
jgi:hypothetical protein